jgi:hypothetical protein
MVLVPADAQSEAGKFPDEKLLEAMGKFNDDLVQAGVMVAGEGLQPTSKGALLRFHNGKAKVIEGPFSETNNLIAGFWIIECKSKEEAIGWMKKAPFDDGVTLQIRQIFEAEDFAPADPTGKIRDNEEELRTKLADRVR